MADPLASDVPATGASPPVAGQSPAARPARVGAKEGPTPRSRSHGWTAYIPPQHGAWAFLIVPLMVGFTLAPMTWAGLGFAVAWILAYPVGYFGGRGLLVRIRRGSLTRLARREFRRGVPWAVALAVVGVPLLVVSPWLALAALVVAAVWSMSLLITLRRSERDLGNDLVLVVLAVLAVPLVWLVSAGAASPDGGFWPDVAAVPGPLWLATAATGAFLFGSVLHVKSLLREAGNVGFRRLSIAYHVLALVIFAVASPWWLIGFVPALLRSLVLRPGLRPAVIGAVETVVAVLFVVAAALAV
ncbi:MAG TPA: YwiC-like family protein [Actinomycetota bacterium]|nr:YwiC-like family protein [Actinomycetota bacterium]